MRRTILASALVGLLVGVFTAAPLAAQPAKGPADPWYGRAAKLQFQPVKSADGFQVEWPKKDWMLMPAAGSLSLVVVSKKGDALVVVERTALNQPLEPADITDLFAQLESDAIKERQPSAAELQSKVIDSGEQRLVAVQYSRPGMTGPERVRQYSLPVGKQLFRLTCVSAAGRFAAYEPVFAHMAATFVAAVQ